MKKIFLILLGVVIFITVEISEGKIAAKKIDSGKIFEGMTRYEIGNTASWAGWGIDNLQGMEKSWEKNTNVYPVGKISGPVYVKIIQEVGAYNSISSIFSILPVAATSADHGK